MPVEAIGAALLALAALWVVLQPLLRPGAHTPAPLDPLDLEETPTGVALAALKDIEFDRETGKLSSTDYEQLKRKYTAAAVAAMRAEQPAAEQPAAEQLAVEEPQDVPDDVEAMIAAKLRLLRFARSSTPPGVPACNSCGPRPEPDAIFCSTCGSRLHAPSACGSCGATLPPDSNFCEACGTRVAA
jgi:hypothetical protein